MYFDFFRYLFDKKCNSAHKILNMYYIIDLKSHLEKYDLSTKISKHDIIENFFIPLIPYTGLNMHEVIN